MKILLQLIFAFLLLVALSRAAENQDDVKDEDTSLKDDIIRKLTDEQSDPEMTEIYLKELEEVMEKELPDDPELRHNILKGIYENLGQGQGQKSSLGQGRRGGSNPFDPFQEVPYPK